jgi:ribosomal peptide maturation radical SAM protein 1
MRDTKSVLLVSMPFAGVNIPSIQLAILESYVRERNIEITTSHLYLKAAEIYGLENYNYLISPPNDSYTAQLLFSRYVFPDHWNKNTEKFKDYFNTSIAPHIKNNVSFEEYCSRTDDFYHWVIDHSQWQNYDIIGFTLNYGQFLPSLAIAKRIKELDQQKKIILGGSRTTGELGIKVLKTFDYIDFIVTGDGEEPLYLLSSEYDNYSRIPGLMYWENNEAHWNQSETCMDLNDLPLPLFDSFFATLASTSEDIQQYFNYYGRLPVEVSRGCWWNKCSFCNLNLQHAKYREKHAEKLIEEIELLSSKFKILNFQIIGNTLPVKHCRDLLTKLAGLEKDYKFIAEARADQLKSIDYTLLKDAGFVIIQTGIESFSESYLKKMNKGTRVIDNIASLKFCKENGIRNLYNLIIRYPNEDVTDFEESKRNMSLLMKYLDPPQLCHLRVVYGSPIFSRPEEFNIDQLIHTPIDTVMFPPEILDKQFNFVYGFTKREQISDNNWSGVVDIWHQQRDAVKRRALKSERDIDQFIFYYLDGGSFLKIFDNRTEQNVQLYILDSLEREVFLACCDVVSLQELKTKFSDVPEDTFSNILLSFVESGITFNENDSYVSLPLDYRKCTGVRKNTNVMEKGDSSEILCSLKMLNNYS